ncbi:MAG: hypothetical protein FJ194_08990 [Gammaproteobacteria bacterium]|nr:hypothetical protein [Gammaproteobacteria bacterium]
MTHSVEYMQLRLGKPTGQQSASAQRSDGIITAPDECDRSLCLANGCREILLDELHRSSNLRAIADQGTHSFGIALEPVAHVDLGFNGSHDVTAQGMDRCLDRSD